MTIALIVAAAGKDMIIGKEGDLPWRLAKDMAFFRETTTPHKVLMGRTTFDSLPKPLVDRLNIVVTRQKDFTAPRYHEPNVRIVHSIADGLALAHKDETLFVIGGANIYAQTLPLADELYLTTIEDDGITGDTHFPAVNWNEWQLTTDQPETDTNKKTGASATLHFKTYKRAPTL